MVLLSEWNDGAVAILLFIFFVLVTLVFLLLRMVLHVIPEAKKRLAQYKQQGPLKYYLLLLLLYIIAALITVGIGYLF